MKEDAMKKGRKNNKSKKEKAEKKETAKKPKKAKKDNKVYCVCPHCNCDFRLCVYCMHPSMDCVCLSGDKR